MQLNKTVIRKAYTASLNIDELVYLYDKATTAGWEAEIPSSAVSHLMLLGYLEGPNTVSQRGLDILASCLSMEVEKREDYSMAFEAFWKSYPKTDKNGFHPMTRKIRGDNKKAIWTEYKETLARGYENAEILNGLLKNLEFMKNTTTPGRNPFMYMKGPANWLRSNQFLEYREEDEKVEYDYGKEVI